jgi:hypothetical protein
MTPEQKFGYHRKHGKMPEETKQPSTTHGVIEYEGREITPPMAYALLQHKRKELISQGYLPSKLKIRKHYER